MRVCLSGDAAIEALGREDAEFRLGQIEPTLPDQEVELGISVSEPSRVQCR
jgi:hypothetical protein